MRYAEQGADVALGHALLSQVLGRSPCLGGGVGAERFGLLAGVPGLAYFFGQRGVQHGHDLNLPYRVFVCPEVQCQQITHHPFRLIQAPGLGIGGMGEIVASDFQRPPAFAAMRHRLEVPGRHQRSSLAASTQSCSNVLKIPRVVNSTISLWRGTSTGRPPTKNLSCLPPCTGWSLSKSTP